MSFPWFRLYSEFATDPVVQSMAFEDQRHFVVLMCLKCSGVLDRNISESNKTRIIHRALGLDTVSANEAKRRLVEVGLIDKKWSPIAWEKRQFVSDHSTQRARKSRKNKETRNDNATELQQDCNAPDTDTDTDTEIRSKHPPDPPMKTRPKDTAQNDVDLPDFMSAEAAAIWQDWIAMLRTRGKTAGYLQQKNHLLNLGRLQQIGFEPEDVIRQSLANEWLTLRELDNRRNHDGNSQQGDGERESLVQRVRRKCGTQGVGLDLDADGGALRNPLDVSPRRVTGSG